MAVESYNKNMTKITASSFQNNERGKMLHDIGMIDFVIVEMTEYLDTHPMDGEAIDYVNYYIKLKNKLMEEYARKYEPLTVATADCTGKEWKWVLQEPPWKGMCK